VQRRTIVVKQRRYFAVLLFVSLVSISIPSTAEAGPLLDWLFQRNRSQGLAGNSNSLFGNSCLSGSRRSGYGNVGGFGGGAPGYGASQNPAANVYAGQQNPNATTAGYAPQGGCSSGWCQQTVVKYVPQVAYRTVNQPVPVTTYKTSTTINPANGLPLTCTRPCTTYTDQARRIPYTTYRPVYTTVPVADTWGQQPQAAPNMARYAPAPQMPNYNQTYAYQPRTGTPGCASCQNQNTRGTYGGGYGGGYSNWSSVPGYTPGNATNLPPYAGGPASAGTPWSDAPLASPQAGASPWRDVQPRSGGYESAPGATAWQNEPSSRGDYNATQWQNEPSGRGFQGGNTPADERPRLNNRPEYPEDYGQSNFRPLTPKPMSEEMRRRIMGPSNSIEPAESSYRDDDGFRRNYAAARTGQTDLFRTPNEQDYGPSNSSINAPTNQGYDRAEESNREYFRGGIRDYDRTQPNTWTDSNDKTANRKGGSMP